MSDNSLPVDLKALSEPATKLIEAVRDAIGVLYEPTRIRRRARAEAAAVVILAKSQSEVREIEERASERLINRELRRQRNIEKITKAALEALPATVSKDPVDEDWIYQFFEGCQDVSNEQMQSLWGRLLAGEVSRPGAFSPRTVRTVQDLAKSDAQLFTNFCAFVWVFPGLGLTPVIRDVELELVKAAGLTFTSLLHLTSIGLIEFNSLSGFRMLEVSAATILYYGRRHTIRILEGKRELQLGGALLTSVGKELAAIAGASPIEAYRATTVNTWRGEGWTVEEQ